MISAKRPLRPWLKRTQRTLEICPPGNSAPPPQTILVAFFPTTIEFAFHRHLRARRSRYRQAHRLGKVTLQSLLHLMTHHGSHPSKFAQSQFNSGYNQGAPIDHVFRNIASFPRGSPIDVPWIAQPHTSMPSPRQQYGTPLDSAEVPFTAKQQPQQQPPWRAQSRRREQHGQHQSQYAHSSPQQIVEQYGQQ